MCNESIIWRNLGRTPFVLGVLAAFLCLIAASSGQACSVPVFRYALERWAADWYEIDVFYRGGLSVADSQRLEAIDDHCVPNGGEANLELVRANLDGQPPADLVTLWKSLGDVSLPHVVVRMPKGGPTVWSGPLADLDADSLLDSPARREISRRLLAGHSVVWLIIGPKDSEATASARKLLAEALPALEEEIPLPAGVGLPGSELLSAAPLTVKFSWLEIDPTDAAETWLLRMLNAQRAEGSPRDEILLGALFGRGRVADVFASQDLSRELLTDVSQFLCGACSCQVKQLNPGFDLLTSTLWEQKLFDGDPSPAEPQATKPDDGALAMLVPIPKGMPKEPLDVPGKAASGSIARRGPVLWGVISLGLAVLVFAASCAQRNRGKG